MMERSQAGSRRADLSAVLALGDSQVPFSRPWELRAFAVAVAACEAGEFPWSEFQEDLTDAIKDWEQANPANAPDDWNYYECFVVALESVLARKGRMTELALDERAKAIIDKPPHKHHVAHREPILVEPAAA